MEQHYHALDKTNDRLSHQDWTPIVISTTKKDASSTTHTTHTTLSEAQQQERKLFKKDEEGDLKHDKVSQDIRKLIQQKRCSLGWTQKQLAQKCNLQVSIINDIETGKAKYNPQHINKLKRVLKL
jgi:ribosome-binding protein aMBF1 (putative translation factor)